jgi:hypothetical protein
MSPGLTSLARPIISSADQAAVKPDFRKELQPAPKWQGRE